MATQLTEPQEKNAVKQSHSTETKSARVDDCLYAVKSQSGNGEYAVTKVDDEWVCECPDNK